MSYGKLLAIGFGAFTFPAIASVITLNAVDSGWWNENGDHDSGNQNYVAGVCAAGCSPTDLETRNFFVFDLTGVSATVIGATLRVNNSGTPGVGNIAPSGVFTPDGS
jgi:hypothetical protein